jgi:hypothetical protein
LPGVKLAPAACLPGALAMPVFDPAAMLLPFDIALETAGLAG